uniref:Cauli_VI domain-containing protein n=1 Tax=Panagrellus redivivus TaxID=6233 RepID=A0A7E4UQ47_PANRE
MSTLQEMMTRNLEMAIEDHKNRFTFKYNPNDPEDDDESVYAFDVPNKYCPNNWHTFEGCHCANYGIDYDDLGSETDVRSVYAFDSTENGEVESVYAFDCEDDTSDEDEPMEANHPKRYTSAAQKAALLEQAKEDRDRREHEDDKKTMGFLATGGLVFIWGCLLRFPWGCLYLFVSGIVFVWAHLQSERDAECLRRDFDQTVQRINSLIVRTAEVDDSEAVETEDDIASVDDGNDAEDQSSDVEDTDEVVSVYAFDSLNSDEAEEEVCPESASPEAIPANGPSSFGFSLPNLGEGLKECRRAHTEDGYFEFWKSITYFQTKTDNYIYIVFKGQDIKTVVNKADIYTSFSEMPSEVAEMLVTVYIGIIDLE